MGGIIHSFITTHSPTHSPTNSLLTNSPNNTYKSILSIHFPHSIPLSITMNSLFTWFLPAAQPDETISTPPTSTYEGLSERCEFPDQETETLTPTSGMTAAMGELRSQLSAAKLSVSVCTGVLESQIKMAEDLSRQMSVLETLYGVSNLVTPPPTSRMARVVTRAVDAGIRQQIESEAAAGGYEMHAAGTKKTNPEHYRVYLRMRQAIRDIEDGKKTLSAYATNWSKRV